tara:strand:- start:24 stop:143 length:120 start_codon:yes stop_codon:yes gene_type:complete
MVPGVLYDIDTLQRYATIWNLNETSATGRLTLVDMLLRI